MTDTLSSQLLAASFKGIQFKVRDEIRTRAGRRIVLHEYPNSNQRFVEDLGQIPDEFSVEAFVSGVDYLDKANALRAALNEAGSGQLTLPTFGTFTAYSYSYSERASQRSVGEIEFRLEFALGRPGSGPTTRERQIEDLYELGDEARGAIELALSILYDPPETALNTAVMQYDVLQQAQSLFNTYSRLFDTDRLNSFDNTIQDTLRERGKLIRSGEDLAANFIQGTIDDPGLFQQISLYTSDATDVALRGVNFGNGLSVQASDIIGATPETSTPPNLNSTDFNAFINQWDETTEERKIRNSNRRVFTQAYRVASLVTAYEQAAAAEYQTEDQVSDVRELLNRAYDAVMRDGIDGVQAVQLRSEVRFAVNDVRFVTLEILERKAQASPGITTTELRAPQSALLLAYNLYAEQLTSTADLTQKAIELRRLNPTKPAMALNDTVTVFDLENN